MTKIIFLALSLISTIAFAGEKMMTMEDDSVPASLITAMNTVTSQDGKVSASLVTVFRGSAAGLSSTIVTFQESLEDDSFSFEISGLGENPKNIKILKKSSTVYKLKFDTVVISMTETGEFKYAPTTIQLQINVDKDGVFQSLERI
ncbi:hypothetical protein K2X05_09165 [bacterium]|nr:hypothetical protein [bacterium]